MKKTVLTYGILMALTVAIFKYLEIQYFSKSASSELIISLLALLFCGVGIWIGLSFRKPTAKNIAVHSNEEKCRELGVSKREMEILEMVAQGYSNQEISEKLFISIHTVKSHSSNLYAKLNAKRRTEAVLNARNLGLISDSTLA